MKSERPRPDESEARALDSTNRSLADPALEVPPVLVDDRRAASALGISKSKLWQMVSAGQAPTPIKLGRRSLWCLDELREWARHGCPPAETWTSIWREIGRAAGPSTKRTQGGRR